MIIVDTSVWIDHFRGKRNRGTDSFSAVIETSDDIAVCGIIMTEVLQGIRSDKEFEITKSVLLNLLYLPIIKSTFVSASGLYRTIRKQGKTIRSPVDCIVAALCIEHEVTLLQNDKDFEVIALYAPLKLQ